MLCWPHLKGKPESRLLGTFALKSSGGRSRPGQDPRPARAGRSLKPGDAVLRGSACRRGYYHAYSGEAKAGRRTKLEWAKIGLARWWIRNATGFAVVVCFPARAWRGQAVNAPAQPNLRLD